MVVPSLVLRAEHAFCIGEGRSKRQQRVAHLLLACGVPVGHFEAAGTLLADLDRVLQVVDPLHVLWVCRIDQYADYQQDVARADLLPCEGVAARVIGNLRSIHVLMDHLHRHEVLARIRQADRHGPRIKIKNARGKERVAVRSHDKLLVDRRQFAIVGEFAETSILGNLAEITIGLGANEAVAGDRDGVACLRLCLSSVDKSQRRQGVDDEFGPHVLFSFRVQFTRLSGGAFHVPSNARSRIGQGLCSKLQHSS